ncbi:arylesterase [Geothermobacter hydrogeniphilus]|uniref:Arylesterase n=1 Tax=Geothermobacter hydrogeniphilus TaxID=1969733 RepID=A0A2K2HEM2_9BACT|nr:arylesterase [Geothermobacter hydrogeniphilus]PNU21744.1 arylesterase [Geothermobacter hydrogeniphilus]
MRLRNYLFFCVLLLVAACNRQPQLSPLAADAVILAYGDSLTHGNGAAEEQSYPAVLEQLLGHKVINAGVPGEISAEGLRRLPRVLEETQPQLVILIHGGNDFLRRLDRERTRKNLQAMIDLCRQAGSDVVLVGVPEPGLFLSPPAFYEELAESNRLPYLEKTLSDIFSDRDLKSDTIHPNAAGYRKLATAVAELIHKATN